MFPVEDLQAEKENPRKFLCFFQDKPDMPLLFMKQLKKRKSFGQ